MRLKIARLVMITVGLIGILIILGEMAIFMMPYSMAKSMAVKISLSGDPHRFTESFFGKVKGQAIWIILSLVILEAFLFLWWKKIEKWIAENFSSSNSLSSLWKCTSISRTEVYILFILIGMGIIFRLVRMQGIMQYDEMHNYLQYAQNPFVAVSAYISDANNHIFHTFLVSLSTKVFGDSIWVIRSVAFLSGILLIPLIFILIRSIETFRPVRSGWLAASIMAAYPLCCEYSANARGYTLQMLLGLLAWALFVKIYEGKRDLLLTLSFICALAMWTIATALYLFVGLIFAFCGGIFWGKIKIKDLFFFIISTSLITLVLWSPVIIVSGIQSILFNPDANPIAGGLLIDPFWLRFKNMEDIISLSLGGPVFWIIPVLVLFGISTINWAWRCIGIGLSVSILTITALLHVTPHTRVWLFLIPLIAIFIDIGMIELLNFSKRLYRKSGVLVGGLCFFYILVVLPKILDYGPGHKEIVTFANQVAKQWSDGQAIEILVDKDRLLNSSPDNLSLLRYHNAYTVRYYLKRQGIPDSAFKWRKHTLSDSIWLVSVKADGQQMDSKESLGNKFQWDVIMGPFALAKHVAKDSLENRGSSSNK